MFINLIFSALFGEEPYSRTIVLPLLEAQHTVIGAGAASDCDMRDPSQGRLVPSL
jgi:hypothetical protein